MDDIYKENILNHFQHPHHKGVSTNCDMSVHGSNPNCGDAFTLYLSIDKNMCVSCASFDGEGCAISQAAASMLMDKVQNMPLDALMLLRPDDIYGMLGIVISSGREQCALLAYNTLERAIKNYGAKT